MSDGLRLVIMSANAFSTSSASLTTLFRASLNSVIHSIQPTHSQGVEWLRESMQTAALSSGRKLASAVVSFGALHCPGQVGFLDVRIAEEQFADGKNTVGGDVVFGQPHGDSIRIRWVAFGGAGREMIPISGPGHRHDVNDQIIILFFELFFQCFDCVPVPYREGLPVGNGHVLSVWRRGQRPCWTLRVAAWGLYTRPEPQRPVQRRAAIPDGDSIDYSAFNVSPLKRQFLVASF